jgi:hypothetical protein
VHIGPGGFVLAVVIVHVLGVLTVSVINLSLIRFRIPLFDCSDLGCMTVVTAEVAVGRNPDVANNDVLISWNGTPQCSTFSQCTVTLTASGSSRRPIVVLRYPGSK